MGVKNTFSLTSSRSWSTVPLPPQQSSPSFFACSNTKDLVPPTAPIDILDGSDFERQSLRHSFRVLRAQGLTPGIAGLRLTEIAILATRVL